MFWTKIHMLKDQPAFHGNNAASKVEMILQNLASGWIFFFFFLLFYPIDAFLNSSKYNVIEQIVMHLKHVSGKVTTILLPITINGFKFHMFINIFAWLAQICPLTAST